MPHLWFLTLIPVSGFPRPIVFQVRHVVHLSFQKETHAVNKLLICDSGWLQEPLDAADVDSSACDETGSVASGDDVNASASSSFLTPRSGPISDQHGTSLLRDDSASSDVDDTVDQHKQGLQIWLKSLFALFQDRQQ